MAARRLLPRAPLPRHPGNGPGRPEGALQLQRASTPGLGGLGEPGWRGSDKLQQFFYGFLVVDYFDHLWANPSMKDPEAFIYDIFVSCFEALSIKPSGLQDRKEFVKRIISFTHLGLVLHRRAAVCLLGVLRPPVRLLRLQQEVRAHAPLRPRPVGGDERQAAQHRHLLLQVMVFLTVSTHSATTTHNPHPRCQFQCCIVLCS